MSNELQPAGALLPVGANGPGLDGKRVLPWKQVHVLQVVEQAREVIAGQTRRRSIDEELQIEKAPDVRVGDVVQRDGVYTLGRHVCLEERVRERRERAIRPGAIDETIEIE